MEQADWNAEFENQFSGGSLSIRLNYAAMRQAGASARTMLLAAAAKRLNRPLAGLVTEIVMTMMFLLIILGATDKRAPQGFAPIAIGLGLTLIHLISIPVTNTSVNPARSTGVAVFVGGWALGQLWLFWVAPIVGGLIGAVVYRFITNGANE